MVTPHLEILRAERVVVCDGEAVEVRPAAVWIEGTTITRITAPEVLTEAPPDAVIHDLGARVLAPAFVNAHTHLAMGAFRGVATAAARSGNVVTDLFFRLEGALCAEDVRAFTRMGAYECLLTGSAEVWDHYYFGEAVAEALLDVGLTGVVAPTLQDLAGPGAERWEAELEATERIAHSERFAAGGVRAALGPHATDTVSPELLGNVVASADRLGLPVHLHVAQSFEEVTAIAERHGCSPIELLRRTGLLALDRVLLVHCVFASAEDLRRLDGARHFVGVCPFSQLQFAFPTPVETLVELGVPWVVGTDCVASNDSMGLQKELALLGGWGALRAAFSPEADTHVRAGAASSAEALESRRRQALAAWSSQVAAEALLRRSWGDFGRLSAGAGGGGVQPGALANLVVYDPDHPCFWPGSDVLRTLAYADTSAAIWGLMVAGRWRGRCGDFHRSVIESDDYREVVREASERRRALLGSLGVQEAGFSASGTSR